MTISVRPAKAKEYRTEDLDFAAYLKTFEIKILRLEPNKTRGVTFVFEHCDDIDELWSEWVNCTGEVVAFDFVTQQRLLKAMLHAQR